MKTSDLKPASYNPRSITKGRLEALERSMRKFGDLSGITFNRKTGRLVGGHQRVKHMQSAWPIVKSPAKDKTGTVAVGYIDTPDGRWSYREVDWNEEKEKAANIAANAHGGDFDKALLAPMLKELNLATFDMKLLGLETKTLDSLLDLPIDERADAEVTSKIEARTKPGDIWELGTHRIICGDTGDAKVVGRLLDGRKLAGVVTSPPYDNNESYEKGRDRDDWIGLMNRFTAAWGSALIPGGAFALNMGNRVGLNNIGHCAQALEKAGLEFMRRVVWKKPDGAGIPVHGHTHKKPHGLNWNPMMVTEDILIYTRGAKRVPNEAEAFDTALFAKFYTDCWQFPGVASDKKLGHPAAFPVLLPQLAISFLTLKNETIGEPFCGAGTTVIAAEMLGRSCYAAELQPKYVDLAVTRWEQFTKKSARRV